MKLLEQLPEKLLGWINRRNSFVKVIFSLGIIWTLIAVIPGTIALIKHVEDFLINLHTPTGSPVIVSGGSLYGVVKPPSVTWLPVSSCSNNYDPDITHCANVKNSYKLSSIGFNPQLTQVGNTQSWKIWLPDLDLTTHAANKNNGIELCSNSTCDSGAPDPKYVYIGLIDKNKSQWESNVPILLNNLQYLFFHDTQTGCDNATAYGGSCDFLIIARIWIDGNEVQPRTCQHVASPGQCAIGIGDPPVQLSSAVALYKKFF